MFKKGESRSCYISPQTHCRQETALLPLTEPQAQEEVRASKAAPLWSLPSPFFFPLGSHCLFYSAIHIGMDSWLFYTQGHNPILPYFDAKNCFGLTTDRQLCSWFLWPSDIFPSVCEHMSGLCAASFRTSRLIFPALGPVLKEKLPFHCAW